MIRKILSVLMLVTMSLCGITTAGYAKSYEAERFDVLIQVQPDGSYIVTETIVFHFYGGDYTYAFREIPRVELDQVNFLEAMIDDVALPEGSSAGQVEVTHGDPLSVKWHFEPTRDMSRKFTLRYRVIGNLRSTGEGDTVYWKAIPEEHEYKILASQIQVTYPENFKAHAFQIEGVSRTPEVVTGPGSATWIIGEIDENHSVSVQLSLPAASLLTRPPLWQESKLKFNAEVKQNFPLALGFGAALLALGGAGLSVIRRRGKANLETGIPLGLVTNPPDDLTPAEVDEILTNGKASFRSLMATIFDLARRGWLEINQEERRAWGRSIKDFRVVQLDGDGERLRPHEEIVLKMIFEEKGGARKDVFFTEVLKKISGQFKGFKKVLDQNLADRGYLDPALVQRRNRLNGICLLVTLISTILILVSLIMIFPARSVGPGLWLASAALALFILGVAGMIVFGGQSVLKLNGQRSKERWTGFNNYLKDMIKNQVGLRAEWLNPFLPFAFVFDQAEALMKVFQAQGLDAKISWLKLIPENDDGGLSFISSVNSFSSGSDGGGGGSGGGGGGSSGAG